MATDMAAARLARHLLTGTNGTELDGLRRKVFLDRYALKDEDGKPREEYPEQMWWRVARGIAAVEPDEARRTEWSEKFYELLRDFKFVPGGRILSGAGTGHQVTYYNCYVVGLGENPLDPQAPRKPMLEPAAARAAFFTALAQMTDIMSRSGGVGMNLSALPPRGTPIDGQDRGKHGVVRPTVALHIGHPDIEILLEQKDSGNLAHVDVAVIVPPAFDTTLAEDEEWIPQWGTKRGTAIKARDLWQRVLAPTGRPIVILRPGAAMLALDDSRDSIVEGAAQAAMALYAGEAPIIDFSALRPKGAYIRTVNGTSSGPIAWMYLFDAVAQCDDGASPVEKGVIWFGEVASVITGKTIQQGGSRRGALMLMIDDDHPDIEEFIAAKRSGPDGRPVMIEHANMSLCISDAFMAAVKADLPWDLKWQGRIVRTVRASDIWDKICTAAWSTAEPGVVFMQRAREQSPMWYAENIRCTNPCGEQPIPAGAVCNLGALNLACYVDDHGQLCEEDLARDTAYATRFLDDVVDATPYFSELHVKMQQEGTRRVGLGTMGLANALIQMRIPYGSAESLTMIECIYRVIRDAAYGASVALADEKGPCGFFERDNYLAGPFIRRLPEHIRAGIAKHGMRNGVVLTQAPTGTTSLLAGVSSGIEPVYDFVMKRVDRIGEHTIYHPLYQEWQAAHPGETAPPYFVSAKDLTPEEHIVVQAKVQEYTDSSISKTANAPFDQTVDDVKRLYTLAYDLGCKGVTYYRDGSRDAVLTSVTEAPRPSVAPESQRMQSPADDAIASASPQVTSTQPAPPATVKPRPAMVYGYTRRVKAPEGTANITINSDESGPLEVFINVGRAGSDIAALAEALGRLMSLCLRLPSAISAEERLHLIATQLRGIGGSRSVGFGAERVLSLPDGVAQALNWHLEQNLANGHAAAPPMEAANGKPAPTQLTLPTVTVLGNICPQCGSSAAFVLEEGCKKCHGCGYSEC